MEKKTEKKTRRLTKEETDLIVAAAKRRMAEVVAETCTDVDVYICLGEFDCEKPFVCSPLFVDLFR